MKRKILIAAIGAALFVGCGTTIGKSPSPAWSPDQSLSFRQIIISEKKEEEPYITYVATPEPTRPVVHVMQPEPVVHVMQPEPVASVKPYKAPRSHENVSRVSGSSLPKNYALSVLGRAQFSCIDAIFTRESHWNYRAHNKYSGAYGIPQALPGSKMSSAGADWKTNPITQVKWGIHYVNGRYGSACGAWRFWQNHHWY